MKKLLLILLCLPFLFTSCRPTQELVVTKTHVEVMDAQCNNKNKADILLNLGAPDRITEDGNDGEILIFDESYTRTNTEGNEFTSFYELFGLPFSYTDKSKTSE